MSYIKQFLKAEKVKQTQIVDEEISQEALPGIDKIAKKIAFKIAYRIFKKLFGNVIREGLADVFAFKTYSAVKAKATLFKVNRVKTSKLIPGYKPGLIPGKGFTDTFIFNDKQITEEADIEKALLVCLKDTKRLYELSSTIADKAEALTLTENEEENGQIMEAFIGKHFPADLFSQFISTKGYTTLEKVQGCTDPDKHILEIEKTIRSTLARTDKVISELAEDEEVDANARKMLSMLLRATLDKHFAFLDNIVEWLYRSIGRQKKEVEEEETSTEGINTDTYSARKLTPKDWKAYFEWFARENGAVIPKDVYQHFTTVEDPVLYILDETGKLVTPYDVSAAITVTKSTNKLTFPTAIPDVFAAESQYTDANYQAKHLRNKHPNQVKSVLGSTKWMPLVVSNNSEYHIIIDMDPAKGGKYGQVISVILHDGETDIQLIANSFTEYLNMIQAISNESVSLEAEDEDAKPESESTDESTENTDTESEDKTEESDDTEEPQEDDEETESDTDADTEDATEEEGTSDEGTEEESETDEVEEEFEEEEEERKEVELDNPDENKVAIRDYLSPLMGEQIDQLKLFTAEEVNRPLYHISMNNNIKMFTPQVSNRTLGKENRSVPRISTSTSLIGCLNGYQSIMSDINGRSPNGFNGLHTVYELPYQYAIKPSKQLLPDVDNSDEYWLISWKKETYATTPSVAAEMFVPKVETVYGNDGRAQLVHLYMHVKEHELYIDHQIKLQPGYYYIKLNNYNYNYPLKNNEESIEVERITENEYNKVTALSIMIKQR